MSDDKVVFPPAARAGVLGRFSGIDLALLGGAVAALWVGVRHIPENWSWVIVCVVVAGLLLALPLLPRISGRRATEYIGPLLGAWMDRTTGRGVYRGAVFAPRSLTDRIDLPGDLAAFRPITASVSDGRSRIGLMVNRREKVVLAVARTSGTTLATTDDQQLQRVFAGWESALEAMGREGLGLRRFQILIRTVEDSTNQVAQHLQSKAQVRSGLPWTISQALATGPAARAPREEVFVVVEFSLEAMADDLNRIDRRWGDEAVGVAVRDRLAEVEHAITEEGVQASWLRPGQYASLVRTQFDPLSRELHDLLSPATADVDARMAGPAAAERSWRWFRHDSGISQTLWIPEMPGEPQPVSFLAPLLQPLSRSGGAVHRSISIVVQPLSEARAQTQVRRQAQRAEDAVADRQRRQLFVSARARREARAAQVQNEAIGQQQTMFRYLMLVTVTGEDETSCLRGVQAMQRRIKRAKCESAVLYGEQDQAFYAGALPFCRGLVPLRGKR